MVSPFFFAGVRLPGPLTGPLSFGGPFLLMKGPLLIIGPLLIAGSFVGPFFTSRGGGALDSHCPPTTFCCGEQHWPVLVSRPARQH